MRKLFVIFILIFCIFNHSFAFETKLESSSDIVEIGDSFSIKIDIYSDENILLEDIKTSGIGDFDIVGQSSSTSTRIINGKVEASLSYIFKLIPKKEGIYQIGPFEIIANGQTKKTNFVTLKVIKSKNTDNSVNQVQNNFDEIKKNIFNFFYIIVILLAFISLLLIYFYIKDTFFSKKEECKIQKQDNTQNNLQSEAKNVFVPENLDTNLRNLENARDVIFDFLELKFGKSFKNATFTEIIDFLKQNNFDDYKIKELEYIFSKLNKYLYSKDKQIDDSDLIGKIKIFVGRG